MPAELLAGAVAVCPDALAELPNLLDQLLAGQAGEIVIHRSSIRPCAVGIRPHHHPADDAPGRAPLLTARASITSRSRALRVSAAARSNSARASLEAAQLVQQIAAHARAAGGSAGAPARAAARPPLQPGRRAERHRRRRPRGSARRRAKVRSAQTAVERGDAGPVGLLRRVARARGRRRWRPAARTARRRRPAPRRAPAPPARAGSGADPSAPRFWSSSRIGSPDGPTRAREREAWISISATRPCTSGSSGASPARIRPSRKRLLAQRRPHPVVARGGGVALVEDRGR